MSKLSCSVEHYDSETRNSLLQTWNSWDIGFQAFVCILFNGALMNCFGGVAGLNIYLDRKKLMVRKEGFKILKYWVLWMWGSRLDDMVFPMSIVSKQM